MKYYSKHEVSQHSTSEDCWIVINDKIYNITRFLHIHPGGKNILMTVAGEDATEYFYALHKKEIIDTMGSAYLVGYLSDKEISKL